MIQLSKLSIELKKREKLAPAAMIEESSLEDRTEIPMHAIHPPNGPKTDFHPVRKSG